MIESTKAPIVVVGAGYVGLVSAVVFAEHREVRLCERDRELAAAVAGGDPRISEKGLPEQLAEVLGSGRLTLHDSIESALADGRPELVFVAVGTPTLRRSPPAAGSGPAGPAGSAAAGAVSAPAASGPAGSGAAGFAANGFAANGEAGPEYATVGPGVHPGDGEAADLSQVESVIGQLLGRPRLAAVMKSTVPPGTGRRLQDTVIGGDGLVYISCPEFLQEGSALSGARAPDRIVVGAERESWATEALRELHLELYPELEAVEMDLTSAESVKHSSNFLLALRISAANQIANFCEQVGADAKQVLRGVGADRRIGTEFLDPGVGFGGSCLEKDVRALRHTARLAGAELDLADATLAVNGRQPRRVAEKAEDRLGGLAGKQIALLGLAFKPGTSDVRASPAFAVARELRRLGASIRAFDPELRARRDALSGAQRREWEVLAADEVVESAAEAAAGADAVIVVTGWEQFRGLPWAEIAAAMSGTLVLDGPNCLDPETVLAAGLDYEGTGRFSRGLQSRSTELAAET